MLGSTGSKFMKARKFFIPFQIDKCIRNGAGSPSRMTCTDHRLVTIESWRYKGVSR